MSRPGRALQIASLAAAAALAGSASAAAPAQCAPRTIGPGTRFAGGTTGAHCLLGAFRRMCRASEYVLTGFTGGTTVIVNFSVQRWRGRCAVLVIRSISEPQQKPLVDGPRVCRRIRSTPGDVVVDRCGRGEPAAYSLTSFA
jgi:hypothetical protein